MSSIVAVGSILGVEEVASFRWSDDGLTKFKLSFNDPAAMISTVHVRLAIEEVIAAEPGEEVPEEVVFGLALNPGVNPGQVESDLKNPGRLVAFLTDSTPVFSYQEGLLGVLEDGAFLGVVSPGGELIFPAMDPADAATLVPDGLTLDGLKLAAQASG